MAKKSAKSAARRRDGEKGVEPFRFDDSKYGHTLFSASFDYGELNFARAAEMLAPRAPLALKLVSAVPLLGIVLCAVFARGNNMPLYVCFALAMGCIVLTGNWDRCLRGYARQSTLAPAAGGERRHVAVTEDAVHLENEQGPIGSYDLSELRTVYRNSDCILAGFGDRRYVYVPRVALSEGRFRELGRFLEERRGA